MFYRNGVQEMTGKRAGEKLYYLDVKVKVCDTSLVVFSHPQPISTWHQRLGHSNYKNVLKMEDQILFLDYI